LSDDGTEANDRRFINMINLALHGSVSIGGTVNDFVKGKRPPHMRKSLFWQGMLVDTLLSKKTRNGLGY